MISISSLSDVEIKYICDVIPVNEVQDYFKRNPKEFAKLKPGFRTTSIKAAQAGKMLYDFRSKHFISSFIEKHIDIWIESIQSNIEMCIQNGDTKYQAYIHTFPDSFFKNNIQLYFEITGEKLDSDIIMLLQEIVEVEHVEEERGYSKKEKSVLVEQEKECKRQLKEKDIENKKLKSTIATQERKLEQLFSKITEFEKEVPELQEKIKSQTKVADEVSAKNDELTSKLKICEKTNRSLEERNRCLEKEHNDSLNTIEKLQEEIDSLEKRVSETEYVIDGCQNVLRPLQMDQFEEFLTYNFEDIGLDTNLVETQMFIKYLLRILFAGKPIIMNTIAAHNVAKCTANCLYGCSEYSSKVWTSNTREKDLIDFLNTAGRIICLDGFLGHCDELALFNILGQYKNKIIFTAVDYDRTMLFFPTEIMSLSYYINVSNFSIFHHEHVIHEDPAIFDEDYYELDTCKPNDRIVNITAQILQELSFDLQVVNDIRSGITNEEDLNEVLLFTILPFVKYVECQNPYLLSARLEKYAGINGRSPIKEILLRWFGNE